MTIAKVINVGAEQLIALPAGFHFDAKQVNISKQEDSLIINIVHSVENKTGQKKSDRQASFLAWRKKYEANIDELDNQSFDNPWESVRSKDDGREFNWEE